MGTEWKKQEKYGISETFHFAEFWQIYLPVFGSFLC